VVLGLLVGFAVCRVVVNDTLYILHSHSTVVLKCKTIKRVKR
jgi:hypothetical protein